MGDETDSRRALADNDDVIIMFIIGLVSNTPCRQKDLSSKLEDNHLKKLFDSSSLSDRAHLLSVCFCQYIPQLVVAKNHIPTKLTSSGMMSQGI